MCYNCTAGNACPSGSGTETACTAGYYSDDVAATCTPCPSGKQCPSTLAIDVEICPNGTYSLGLSQACTTCPTGKCFILINTHTLSVDGLDWILTFWAIPLFTINIYKMST